MVVRSVLVLGSLAGVTSAEAPRPAVLADCESTEIVDLTAEPDALPPDLAAEPRLLLTFGPSVYAGMGRYTQLNSGDLGEALEKRIATLTKIPFVTKDDLRASLELIKQKRIAPDALVCGQAPNLRQVVGARVKNLIVAEVGVFQKKPYQVIVTFTRAGSTDTAGLPAGLSAPVTRSLPDKNELLAAASKLKLMKKKAQQGGGGGGLFGIFGDMTPVFIRTRGTNGADPWLRVATVFNAHIDEYKPLAACVDSPASYDVTFAITPAGATKSVSMKAATAGSSKTEKCLRTWMQKRAFGCTKDGKDVSVSLRVCVAPKPTP